jgi:hypothetical protein
LQFPQSTAVHLADNSPETLKLGRKAIAETPEVGRKPIQIHQITTIETLRTRFTDEQKSVSYKFRHPFVSGAFESGRPKESAWIENICFAFQIVCVRPKVSVELGAHGESPVLPSATRIAPTESDHVRSHKA